VRASHCVFVREALEEEEEESNPVEREKKKKLSEGRLQQVE
jgi:hypothetical protein